MPSIHVDFETSSHLNVSNVSPWKYAEHDSTGIICMAYAIDDQPVRVWTPDEPFPSQVLDCLARGAVFYAHNVAFEKAIYTHVLPRYCSDLPKVRKWRCTASVARYKALPGGLKSIAQFLDLEVQKDMEGRKTMLKWAKKPGEVPPDEDLEVIKQYCSDDVEVERAVHRRLGHLPYNELKVWLLDQEMNERGIPVDLELAEAVKKAIKDRQAHLLTRFQTLVGGDDGALEKPTQVQKFREWIEAQWKELPDLRSETVKAAIEDPECPPEVREALEIRQACSKTSTAKFDRMLADCCRDGTIKDGLVYHGATTGRWNGSGLQPLNLPRPTTDEADELAEAFKVQNIERVEALAGGLFNGAKSAIRAAITPLKASERLVVLDFASIEARGLVYLAGEQWKVQAFKDYDAGEGPDIYKLTYSRSFHVDPDTVTKEQRLIGKVQELALGYGGGVGAFETMANIYGVQIGDHYEQIVEQFPDHASAAEELFQKLGRGRTLESFVAADVLKRVWREAHPATVEFWSTLEDDAIEAVRTGSAGTFTYADRELRYLLPSGRALTYWDPKIKQGKYGPELHYKRSQKGMMLPATIYGGKWAENVTQAFCRDLLVTALLRAAKEGIDVRLPIHDEIVAISELSVAPDQLQRLDEIMREPVLWAPEMPIATDGFISTRYRK